MQSWAIMPLTHCKVFWFDKKSWSANITTESTTLMMAVAKIDNANTQPAFVTEIFVFNLFNVVYLAFFVLCDYVYNNIHTFTQIVLF